MNGKEIDGTLITVKLYDAKEKVQAKVGSNKGFTNLYVKNFPNPTFDDEDLIVRQLSSFLNYNYRKSSLSMVRSLVLQSRRMKKISLKDSVLLAS